jgi:hypothetical protein
MLVNQPTNTPTLKVQAVGVTGTMVTVVLLVASIFGLELPAESVNEVAVGVSALVTLVTFVAGYFKKNKG